MGAPRDRMSEALAAPSVDRDAGALGAVPAPPPRAGSFTGPTTAEGGKLSRASSTHSVSSWGSVPRSSSFTRSRKFARGDVLSLDDARHVLESNHNNYSLKFAAAQQILQEHLPSLPQPGELKPEIPAPPSMPENAVCLDVRQPGEFPKTVPIPLIKPRKRRDPTPSRPRSIQPTHPDAFNIVAPASVTKPKAQRDASEDDEEEEERGRGGAFARILSRSVSNKRNTASTTTSSTPKMSVETPKNSDMQEKKKVLRFDDRNPDLHIAVASSATIPMKVEESEKKKRKTAGDVGTTKSKPHKSADRETEKLAVSTSPTRVDASSSRDSEDTGISSGSGSSRLQRARSFFVKKRYSSRTAANSRPGDRLEEAKDEAVVEADVSRLRASSSASQIDGRKRTATDVESGGNMVEKKKRLPRAASAKAISVFDARGASANDADDANVRRVSSAVPTSTLNKTPTMGASSPDMMPTTEGERKEKTPLQKSFARAQAVSVSFVKRARKLPRSVTLHRMGSRGASTASSAKNTPVKQSRVSEDANAKPISNDSADHQVEQVAGEADDIEVVGLPKIIPVIEKVSKDASGKPKKVHVVKSDSAKIESAIKRTTTSVSKVGLGIDEKLKKVQVSKSGSSKKDVSDVSKGEKTKKANISRSGSSRRNSDKKVGSKQSGSFTMARKQRKQKGDSPAELQSNVKSKVEASKALAAKTTNENLTAPIKNQSLRPTDEKAVEGAKAERHEGNTISISNRIALWDKAVQRENVDGAPVADVDLVVAAPMTEERAAADFGASTKDLPEFVTIKKVIRRKKADGSEEIVTKRVRERPTAVRPNGDVVVQRTVRRLKKDGSGEKETVVIEKIIPRRGDSGEVKLACKTADIMGTTENPANLDGGGAGKVEKEEKLHTATGAQNRALRDEDWPARYRSLSKSASKDKLTDDQQHKGPEEVKPGSFGMMQQGLPHGSSFPGQEPYVHDKRRVRMPGAEAYMNVSELYVESTVRQTRIAGATAKRSTSGLVRAISRRKGAKKKDKAATPAAKKEQPVEIGDAPALAPMMSLEEKTNKMDIAMQEGNTNASSSEAAKNGAAERGGAEGGKLKTLVSRFKRRMKNSTA